MAPASNTREMAQAYLDQLSELMAGLAPCLSTTADLTIRHFFSGAAVYAADRICISFTPAGFALKLPRDLRSELLAEKGVESLQYFPDAPLKKAYVVLPQRMLEETETLCFWVDRSIEYVLTLPRPKKKS